MSLRNRFFGALLLLPTLALPGEAQDFPGASPKPDGEAQEPARREYLGRKVARTMHWRGAEWLTRDGREKEERTQLLLSNLGLNGGEVVGDLGAGNGYLSLPMAGLVGPTGRVLAADLQPEMLELLRSRAAQAGIENIETVPSTVWDPGYPEASCDLIIMVDVYHELDRPETVLAGVRRALRPGGRLALVEFRTEDRRVPIKPDHKMTKAQMLGELAFNGLVFDSEYDGLPWQHLVFFTAEGGDPLALTQEERSRRSGQALARGAARAWLADDGPSLRGFLADDVAGRGAWDGGIDRDFNPRTFGGQGWQLEYSIQLAEPGPGQVRLWCSAPAGDLVGRLREQEPGLWKLENLGFVPVLQR